MSTTTTWHMSTTGKLHRQGCGALSVGRSAVRPVGHAEALAHADRCELCVPDPEAHTAEEVAEAIANAKANLADFRAARTAWLAEQDIRPILVRERHVGLWQRGDLVGKSIGGVAIVSATTDEERGGTRATLADGRKAKVNAPLPRFSR